MYKYYLGVDVSKGYADFIILNENKEIVEQSFQLDDTFAGHNKLHTVLSEFISRNPGSIIYSAVESTGGFENNWFNTLHKFQKDLNIFVARLNPLMVYHNSKADLKRSYTDKISAENVAEYLISHEEKVEYQKVDYFSSLRRQFTHLQLLKKQKTQLLNQLQSIVYSANPEILSYCKDGVPQWVLKLLKEYPTSESVANAKSSDVAKIPYIIEDFAEGLIESAKKSVASTTDKTTGKVIKSTVEQILNLTKVIDILEDQLAKSCNIPEVEILKSFKGIGDYSAIGLMLAIGAVERFIDVKKIASFFGLHPEIKISGDGQKVPKMSKKGSSVVRYILFNVARAAIIHNTHIRKLYNKLLKRGKCKMAAIGIIMHKILRIIYGMLKHKQLYNPVIDIKNCQTISIRSNTSKINKTRRYLNYDKNAPISRRQCKKRIERVTSQNE
jgi:transposase